MSLGCNGRMHNSTAATGMPPHTQACQRYAADFLSPVKSHGGCCNLPESALLSVSTIGCDTLLNVTTDFARVCVDCRRCSAYVRSHMVACWEFTQPQRPLVFVVAHAMRVCTVPICIGGDAGATHVTCLYVPQDVLHGRVDMCMWLL